MRDIFEEIFHSEPADPIEAARRAMRPSLRRRFYRNASVTAGEGGFGLVLDGKPVRTPARHMLALPTRPLAAAAAAIPHDPWRLGAVHAVTTLTGSCLIALALAAGRLSVDAAWEAAHVDDDWNMAQWGRDALALERRSLRFAEMQAAATVL